MKTRTRAGRRTLIMFGFATLLLFVREPLFSQTPQMTEEERNTIEVIRQGNQGVVHIKVRATREAGFEKVERESGTGTGFLIDREGHILTNYHVVENMNQIEVVLTTGHSLSARLVGTAPQLDVALLQVDAPKDELFPLKLGDSSTLQMGQKAIAIGNPLGLHNTVTVGVVSALRRTLGDVPLELQETMIQTDAAINPGSSGGPLLNSAGEVIGINAAIVKDAQNLGFAIPINLVRRVIPDLIEMGHPYRPQLGFSASEITPNVAKLFGVPLEHGLLVEEVLPGSPASITGLRAGGRVVLLGERPYVLGGDIITAVNGKDISSSSELAQILMQAQPGEKILLTVYRGGQTLEMPIRLERMKMEF